MKKRIIIAVVVVVLLILIAVGAYFLLNKLNNKKGNAKQDKTANSKPAPAKAQPKKDQAKKKAPANGEKIMKQMCGATDYKDKCESIIGKAKGASKPKEFIKTAISAASDEARIAYSKSSELTFNSPEEKGAFEDCKVLFEDAMDELWDAISQIGNTTTSGKIRTVS